METPSEPNPKSGFNFKPEMNIRNIQNSPRGRFWQIASVVVILHIAALGTLVLFQSCSKNEPPALTETDSISSSLDELAPEKETASELTQSQQMASLPHKDALTPEEHLVSHDEMMASTSSEADFKQQEVESFSEKSEKTEQEALSVKAPVAPTAEKVSVPTAVPVKSASSSTYVVRKGDTLAKISKKYKVSLASIVSLNRLDVKAPLKIGQKIAVPSSGKMEVAKKSTPPMASDSNSGEKTHVIKSGENPISIAKRYGVSVESLLRVNRITDPKKLRINQKLIIPATAETKTAAPSFAAPRLEELRPTSVDGVMQREEVRGI